MTAILRLLLLFTALLPWAAVQAQAPAAAHAPGAKLNVGARTVFVFRAALAGYSPQDRADGARKRLDKALAAGAALQTATRTIPEGTQVLLDGRLLFLVTPGDVNALAGDDAAEAARESAVLLATALRERQEQDSPRYLLLAGGLCIAASAAYVLVLRALGLLQRRARVAAERLLARRLRQVRIRNVALLDAGHFIGFMRQVSGVLLWALRLFATFVWLTFLLGQVPYSRSWGEMLRDYLVDTLVDAAAAVAGALPGLLVVLVIGALARMASLTVRSVLQRVESGALQLGWLDRDTAPPTRRLLNVAIVLFALAMAYPYLPGSHTAAFQGVTVLAGLMVSIGGSSIVAQGASGLILMYTRALRKGEHVRIGDAEGTVVELGMFETRLQTGLGAEVSLPNALVLSNSTRNFSRTAAGAPFSIEAALTVGYDTPWRDVHAMLASAAAATDGILDTPAPFVAQAALSDFYVEYRLVAHARATSAQDRVALRTRLHQQIIDEFARRGVRMTSPHFTQEPLPLNR